MSLTPDNSAFDWWQIDGLRRALVKPAHEYDGTSDLERVFIMDGERVHLARCCEWSVQLQEEARWKNSPAFCSDGTLVSARREVCGVVCVWGGFSTKGAPR